MDKFDSDLVNLQATQADPNGCRKCPPANRAGGHQDARPGGRGSDPRAVRPGARESSGLLASWGSPATPSAVISPEPRSAFKNAPRRVASTTTRSVKSQRPLRHRRRGERRRHSAGTRRSRDRRRVADPATSRRAASSGGTGRGLGHRPVRDLAGSTDADRLRREDRADRRSTRDGPPDDRRSWATRAGSICRAFLAQRQDDWLEGLDGAFRHFGGLTEQILCDNASPLVTSHDRQYRRRWSGIRASRPSAATED